MEKAELVITALQQRIGEIVSNYETQVAILRAEITTLINEKKQKDLEVEKYSEEIAAKIGIENPE
jgi:sRNA-binding carbon storage regulator CsrA